MVEPADGDGLRILQVIESCLAGVGQHVRSLSEWFVREGHDVTVAYSPHRPDEAFRRFVAERREEIQFIPLEVRRPVSPLSDLRALALLARFIRREGPFDVVHGHSSKGGALARLAGRVTGTPAIYTPNSLILASDEISRTENLLYTGVERSLGRLATSRIIAVSQGERELIRRLRLVSEERIALVENGIEDEDFAYFSGREPAGESLEERPLTFGSLMRFSPQKKPEHLVEAFVRLRSMLPQLPLRLVIAGDGELFGRVERQVAASGMEQEIELLGWRTDTREVLRGFDVFVLPSLYEAGSYTVMEAMAAKLPVVSTAVFGTEETVGRVPGNVVVPAGDPEALARGMKELATLSGSGSLRRVLGEIGRANHDYAGRRFRQSETARRTLEVYRAVCRARSAAS